MTTFKDEAEALHLANDTLFPLGTTTVNVTATDAAGNMSAQLMSADRPLFSARAADDTPDAEFKQAFLTYTSYWGTYRIDEAARTVTHTVIGANAPNFATLYVILDDFPNRRAPGLTADAVAARLQRELSDEVPGAHLTVFGAPAVSGLGRAGG